MSKLIMALAAWAFAGSAMAKLPPLPPEAAAKAAEAKSKTAWSGKVAAYQLCLSQDKTAARYRAKAGKPAAPASTCQNPGAYVAQTASAAPAAPAAPAAAASK